MKTFLSILICCCFPLMTAAQQKTESASPIPDSIQQQLDLLHENTQRWMDAYNSGDSWNLVPLYAENAEYISSHVSGLVAKGREQVIANFQRGMDMGGRIDAIEVLSSNISGGLATLSCRYQATNSGVTVIGRNLLVMKLMNGKWLIVLHMTVV